MIVTANVKNVEWNSDRVNLPSGATLTLDGNNLRKGRTMFIANESIEAAARAALSEFCGADCTGLDLDGFTIDTDNNH